MSLEEPAGRTSADFGRRVRRWRDRQGLTLAQLASKADLSIGYLSLLERGLKVPSPSAAARLARSLGDDESLYRSWAAALRAGVTTSDVDLMRADTFMAAAMAPASVFEDPYTPEPDVVAVRILPPHADPADPDTYSAPPLFLDRRFLGAEEGDRLFAYQMTSDATALAGGVAAPGDHVVFSSRVTRITPSRVYAVRRGRAITIARLSVVGDHLVIVPPAGEADVETIPGDWRDVVRGVAVVVIRRLLPGRSSPYGDRASPREALARLDDAELISRHRDGDREATSAIVRRVMPLFLAVARASTLPADVQERLGRDAFAKLADSEWRNLRSWVGPGSLVPYLARVARWAFNDEARRRRGLGPGTTDLANEDALEELPEGALGPLEILRDRRRMKAIEHAVRVLGPRDQELIYRRYIFEQPNAEIAETMGMALGTLHVALSRARSRLEAMADVTGDPALLRPLLDRMAR